MNCNISYSCGHKEFGFIRNSKGKDTVATYRCSSCLDLELKKIRQNDNEPDRKIGHTEFKKRGLKMGDNRFDTDSLSENIGDIEPNSIK